MGSPNKTSASLPEVYRIWLEYASAGTEAEAKTDGLLMQLMGS